MERFKCTSREMLEAVYSRCLNEYSGTMARLSQAEGFPDAEALCAMLSSDCKAAREELRRHEAEHGCRRAESSAA